MPMRPPITAGEKQAPAYRLSGRRLLEARRRLYARAEGRCAICGRLLLKGWIRDHKTPLAAGGLEAESNVQALCRECNKIKTRDEAVARNT